jgi:hypothetical protein
MRKDCFICVGSVVNLCGSTHDQSQLSKHVKIVSLKLEMRTCKYKKDNDNF